jgi:hypothetical protein
VAATQKVVDNSLGLACCSLLDCRNSGSSNLSVAGSPPLATVAQTPTCPHDVGQLPCATLLPLSLCQLVQVSKQLLHRF